MQNPHNAVPPDYTTDKFAPSCQRIINAFNLTHQEAADQLCDLWQAQNAINRQDWDAQQEIQAAQRRQEQEQIHAQQEQEEREKQQEEEEAKKEERKKYCAKFLPFADVPPPSTIPITPSPLAPRKLRKGEYVPLYFFTNKGLADAQSTSNSLDEEALALVPGDQGSHSFVPIMAARAKQSIIEDQDLSWAQINESTHCFLKAIKEADWPQECIDALYAFWINLASHE